MRTRAGLTQEQLAERAGIGASYVARIEVGQRRPTLDVLAELAESLGVPLHRLLADERSVRAAEGQEAFGKTARQLNGVILELDDPDVEILLKVANRLKR